MLLRGWTLRPFAFLGSCFACAFGATMIPAPASAEPLRVAQMIVRDLPPYEMEAITRSLGLRPITRPVRQGPHYVLRAIDRRGEERRVVVDARYGEVISAVPVVRMPGYPAGARVVRLPREDDEIDMTPPAPIPPRAAPAPAPRPTPPAPRTSAVAPAEPPAERASPLPRPRPETMRPEKAQPEKAQPETTQSTAAAPQAPAAAAQSKPADIKPPESKPAEVKKIIPAPVPDVVPLD